VRLVGAEIEHGAIVVKDVLGAVTVVDVPIDDEDLFDAVGALGLACGDGFGVEDAEPHAADAGGMVAAGADGAESIAEFTGDDGVNRCHGTTDGEACTFE
jgi:hypothetical protein